MQKYLDQLPPWGIILCASLVSILLMQEDQFLTYIGLGSGAALIVGALVSPWMGLLTLFPLAFAMHPTPAALGVQEMIFAAMMVVVFVGAVKEFVELNSIKEFLRKFGGFIFCASSFFVVNYFVGFSNEIKFSDWLRGAIPFVFMFAFIPVAILVGGDKKRFDWFCFSVLVLVLLMSGYIVSYYFDHSLWKPYWTIEIDGNTVRVDEDVAMKAPELAYGPLIDRITMQIQRATDALLPIGIVIGAILAVLGKTKWHRSAGLILSMLCLAAVLITFTRSMLLSSLVTLFLFLCLLFVYCRNKVVVALKVFFGLGVFGIAFIFLCGMENVWFGRLIWLVNSVFEIATSSKVGGGQKSIDSNVSTRMQEYKIAWEMFVNHPLLGNGLGVKHEMRWETTEGQSLFQLVAYVHNWPLYMLMVGGITGLLVYMAALLGPVLLSFKSIKSISVEWVLICSVLVTMAVYGLFFAVFRLITFNLLCAAAWGLVYAGILSSRQECDGNP